MNIRKTFSVLAGTVLLVAPLHAGSFSDDFARPDGTDVGPGWSEARGDWLLSDERAVPLQEAAGETVLTEKLLVATNVNLDQYPIVVSADMAGTSGGRWGGVAIHVQPDNPGNFYTFIVRTQGSKPSAIQFRRYVDFALPSGSAGMRFTQFAPAELSSNRYFRYTIISPEPGLFHLRIDWLDPETGEVTGNLWSRTQDDREFPGFYQGGAAGLHANSNGVAYDRSSMRALPIDTAINAVAQTALEIDLPASPGRFYQWQWSPDLIDWEQVGRPTLARHAETHTHNLFFSGRGVPRGFYRAISQQ